MESVKSETHQTYWWWIKVLCGVALIAGLVAKFVFFVELGGESIPVLLAQIVVVFGGSLYIYHYILVKNNNPEFGEAQRLTDSGGLFTRIRHPMYLSDALYYAGLAMLWPSALSVSILLLAWVALVMQAREEDSWCERQFGAQHEAWRSQTKLLIPHVY